MTSCRFWRIHDYGRIFWVNLKYEMENNGNSIAWDILCRMHNMALSSKTGCGRRYGMCMVKCPACKGRICDIIATAGGKMVLQLKCPNCGRIVRLEWLLQITEKTK